MGRLSEKVVPSWDTDLTYRLQQLDNVLAASSKTTTNNSGKSNNPKSANSTSDEEEPEQVRKRYACPHCDARFNSCGARNSHRRKVHERFHLCHECDIAFGSAQKLDRHMKTHTGIKEFKCETCGKEFMIERNLVSSMTLLSYNADQSTITLTNLSGPTLQIAPWSKRFHMFRLQQNLLHKIGIASSHSAIARTSYHERSCGFFLQALFVKMSYSIRPHHSPKRGSRL